MFSGSVWKNIAVLGIVALISGITVFTIHSITKASLLSPKVGMLSGFFFKLSQAQIILMIY